MRSASRHKLWVAPFFCAVSIAACGGSTAPSSTVAPRALTPLPSGVRGCSSRELALSYQRVGAAAGHVEATFELRNRSVRDCTLFGYPGVRLFDAAHRPLPTRLSDGNGFFPDTVLPPRLVRMKRGAVARFGVSYSDVGRACRAAATLEALPPNAEAALRVSLASRGGGRFAPCGGRLVVSPVYAG